MRQVIINIPPFASWEDARNTIQKALKDLSAALISELQSGQLDGEGFTVVGVADPVNPTDAATKNYVDQNLKTLQKTIGASGGGGGISGPVSTVDVIPIITGPNTLGESSLSDDGTTVMTLENLESGAIINAVTGFAKNGLAGTTGTATLAKITGGGFNGSLSIQGGIVVSITNPT